MYLNVVSHLSTQGKILMKKMEDNLPKKIKKYNYLIVGCCGVLFFVVVFLVPAFLITLVEDWKLQEALYFTFITLSTIGK